MASEAEIKGKLLAEELSKPLPNSDVVYYLTKTQPYWNTTDTEKLKRGYQALQLRNKLKTSAERD